jgi:hypothetical protein
MANQIVVSAGAKVRNLSGVLTATSGVVSFLPIDVSLGIPQLDVNGKILVSQLPNSVMEYKGTWDISTNTPTLVNGTGNQGDVYLVEGAAVGGTSFNFGAGGILFFNGDQAIYSGSIWQRGSGATGSVTSISITESGDSLNITGSPITTSGTINIGFNGTNLQYVNGAGNLTTFPILTGYVPYTGATGDVNLGLYSLTSNSIKVIGDNSTYGGTLSIKQSNVTNLTGVGYTELFGKTNRLGISFGAGSIAYLSNSTLTAERTYTFPDATGTLALTSDLSAYVTLAGTETITGAKTFSATSLTLAPTSGGGTLNLKQDAFLGATNGYTSLTSSGSDFAIIAATGVGTSKQAVFSLASLGATLRTYTFPDANGTIALTSDLNGYVPYSGATLSLDLGIYSYNGNNVIINGNNSTQNGTLLFKQVGALAFNSVGYSGVGILGTTSMHFNFNQSSGVYKQFNFSVSSLTNNTLRTLNIPDASGTIALTSDLSAYVTLAGTETITGAKTFSGLTSFTNTSGINLQYGAYINKGNTPLAFSSGNTNIYSDATTNNIVIRDNLSIAKLEFNNSTQTYTFPAATGTIALTSDLTGGTVTSVAALTIGTTGTDLSSTVANSTTTPVITLNVPTASAVNRGALSSADWTTFNNKQSALTNPVTGTGTTNYLPKFTGTSTIGNSLVFDNGTNVGIGTNNPTDPQGFGGALDIQNASAGGVIYLRKSSATTTYGWFGYDQSSLAATIAAYGANNKLLFNAGTGAIKMTLDASGNLGLGVTPSAWRSTERALQIGATTSVTDISNFAVFRNNNYVNSSGQEIYITTNGASALVLAPTSEYRFLQAAAGTAGNIISFTQAMTLTAAGRLLLGTTTESTYLLDVNGTGRFGGDVLFNSAVQLGASSYIYGSVANGFRVLNNANTVALLTITNTGAATFSGNVGIKISGRSESLAIEHTTGNVSAAFFYTSGVTTGQSYGLTVYAGTNSSDRSFLVSNQGGGTEYFKIRGDGAATFSSSVTAGSSTSSGYATLNLIDSGTGSARYASIRKNYDSPFDLRIRASNSESAAPIVFDLSNAVEAMRITSGGNVGIGTVSPAYKLEVQGPSNATAASSIAAFFSGPSASYNLVIGQDAQNASVYGGSIRDLTILTNNTGLHFLVESNAIRFSTYASATWNQRMTILNNGNVLIGTTTDAGAKLVVSDGTNNILFTPSSAPIIRADSSTYFDINNQGGGLLRLYASSGIWFRESGVEPSMKIIGGVVTITNLGSGSVSATSGVLSAVSDMNLKNEDGFINNALDKVMNLKPRYYHWKKESGLPTDLRQLGFYAQEVNQALGEEAANTPKTENDKWGIYDRGMIAFLTAAIQEQQAQIEELKQIVATINK